MSNIIERLRAQPRGPLCDEAADTITRLQGEAKVLLMLLSKALEVLYTIEPECATEHENLEDLTDQIEAVLKARPV